MSGYAAGAGIVGGALESAAAGLERAAMEGRLKSAEQAQQGYRDWAGREFAGALQPWGQGQVSQAMGASANQRLSGYNALQQQPMSFAPSMGTSVTNAQDAGAIAAQSQRQAHLNSYSDWLLKETFRNMAAQRGLNRASSFASGTASLLPLQLYQSQHSLDWLSQLGQSISTLGGAMGSSQYGGASVNQAPQGINMGGQTPALWSGYGGVGNLPPAGTSYNQYTNQSVAPGTSPYFF